MSSIAKQKQEVGRPGFLLGLLQFGLYKPSQGRVVRQLTFAAIAVLWFLSAYEVERSGVMNPLGGGRYLALIGLTLVGAWLAFRIVHYAPFADFLISVEAEMNKVSWPSRKEMWNASMVVIFVIFAMAAFLFFFDAIWTFIFEAIGIRYSDSEPFLIWIFRSLTGG